MAELQRILLVDDEAALLKLMGTYLERLGYAVEAYLTGTEALARFDLDPNWFALLIADQTLKDMDGIDMALGMAERNQNLRVLLCSGYPFEVSSIAPELRPRFASLQKPFLPNMLAKAVDDLLHS